VTTHLDKAAIDAAIDRLYARRHAPGYQQSRLELLKELNALVSKHPESMLAVGEDRLEELSNAPQDADRLNYGLHLLFDFFEGRRLPQIRALVERALQNENFRMKERYIQTLEEFGDPASVPPLIALLSLHRGSGIEAEDIRVAVLQALAAYFPALADPSPVLDLLGDESLRVRTAALRYLLVHPVDVAAPTLAARAQVETDPDLLAAILDLHEQADPAGALAAAEERLASTPASQGEVIEPLQSIVGRLRARRR
jgi:hypothetical protein